MNRPPSIIFACFTLFAIILQGCASATPIPAAQPSGVAIPVTGTPVSTAIVVPTAPPAATGTPAVPHQDTFILPGSCYREGLPTFVNRAVGFCFAYPHHFALGEMNPGEPAILGPALDTSPDPLRATFTFQVKPAAGTSLANHLAAYMLETNTSPETRLTALELDGEAGKVVDPVKGRPNARSILVLHGDNLYILNFAPTLKDTPASQQSDVWKKGQTDMEALYEVVASSFAFLDRPRMAGANDVLGITGSCIAEGTSLYLDSDQGYCLAVPPRFVVDETNPGQRAILGPPLDASPDPLRASLFVDVKPAAAGSQLNSLADAFVKANPSSAITSSATELGGREAMMLKNVPARMMSSNVLALNSGRLYNLYFQPHGSALAKPDFDALNALAMRTFGFLPSPTPAQPTSVGGSMPMLKDVSWATAQEMILGGQVKAVTQAHSLQVSLTLKDGRVVHTIEPEIDEVIHVIRQCGPNCSQIVVSTE